VKRLSACPPIAVLIAAVLNAIWGVAAIDTM